MKPPRRSINGVLLLDKPTGITSNAALVRVRSLLSAMKAGHTGTLDPLATGLLPIAFGEATKFAGFMLDADKSYQATIRLGVTTTTGDADGEVIAQAVVTVTAAELEAAVGEFLGTISQVPPMHSALKFHGRRLYQLAREGIEVPRAPRRVEIHAIRLLDYQPPLAKISVACSKGTYIRPLAEDIGQRLGCGGTLQELRRARIGRLAVEDAIDLDRLSAAGEHSLDALLRPADELLGHLPGTTLGADDATALLHGQRRQASRLLTAGLYRLYGEGIGFVGLAQTDGDCWIPIRLLSSTLAHQTQNFAAATRFDTGLKT